MGHVKGRGQISGGEAYIVSTASQIELLLQFLWLTDATMWPASQGIIRRGREGVCIGEPQCLSIRLLPTFSFLLE